MSDWLREGLDDLASEAPTAPEVPPTLPRRARRQIAFTVVGSLVVVVALTAVAVAGGQALFDRRGTGISPAPTPPTPSVSPGSLQDNAVRVSLGQSGCSLRAGEIVPGRLTFYVASTSDRPAIFDIGVIQEGHTFEELASHVEAMGTGPVADSLDEVAALRPPYFHGSLGGRSPGGGRPLPERPESLIFVTSHSSASWFPLAGEAPPGSTMAVICYLASSATRAVVPAGVVGPVISSSLTVAPPTNHGFSNRGVLLASISIDDRGCRATRSQPGVVEADYVRFQFRNDAITHVEFDIGVLADGTTFDEFSAYIAGLPRYDDPQWPDERQPGFVRMRESWGEIGFPRGGMGPHIGNPFGLKQRWTAEWTGPGGELAPVGPETIVVICYRNLRTGPGMTPIAALGPFLVR